MLWICLRNWRRIMNALCINYHVFGSNNAYERKHCVTEQAGSWSRENKYGSDKRRCIAGARLTRLKITEYNISSLLNLPFALCNSNTLDICIGGNKKNIAQKRVKYEGAFCVTFAGRGERSCETKTSRLQCHFGFMNKYPPGWIWTKREQKREGMNVRLRRVARKSEPIKDKTIPLDV